MRKSILLSRLLRLLFVSFLPIACSLFPISCLSQTVTVTTTNLHDGGTLACPTGTTSTCILYWAPVTSGGIPTAYRSGSGGQGTATPVPASVINGVSSVTLPDSCYTSPISLCWRVTLLTQNGASVLGTCVQPSSSNYWFASGVDNFDNWNPSIPPTTNGAGCTSGNFAIYSNGTEIATEPSIAISANGSSIASASSISNITMNGSAL